MNEKNVSVSLGERLRFCRKQAGLTLEQLAEMANTTPQTISNYEKKGITNTDVEAELSRILGKSLRDKPEDKEGTVGEVGKEILYSLMENEGSMSFNSLLGNLYGLNEERTSIEIEKLSDMYMVVREKYTGFESEERDYVYITAKGIITCKNHVADEYHASKYIECLSKVVSYEERLKPNYPYEADLEPVIDMEEYVSKRPWISEILKLELTSTYKADYIAYLYQNGAMVAPKPYVLIGLNCDKSALFPGKNIYYDILYRMAYGFDDKWREKYYFNHFDKEWSERFDELYFLVNGDPDDEDEVVNLSLSEFKKDFPWVKDDGLRGTMKPFAKLTDSDEKKKVEDEYNAYDDLEFEVNCFLDGSREQEARYKEYAPNGLENKYPDKWFSKDEIEDFIRKNYHLPQNEQERKVQKIIDNVERLRPRLKAYYSFPKEWEENGLANLVRELNGICK